MKNNTHTKKAFTIIELIVAVSIILILLSLAMVFFRGAVDAAKKAESISNMRSVAAALHLYANDHSGRFPPGRPDAPSGGGGWGSAHRSQFWMGLIIPYITGQEYDIDIYRNLSAARGFRRDFDDAFFCPQSANPHPYGSFALNPILFPRDGDGTPADRALPGPLMSTIMEPSKTVLLIDAAPTSGDWDSSWTKTATSNPRRRPDGSTSIAFFDGRVENFEFEFVVSRLNTLYNPNP